MLFSNVLIYRFAISMQDVTALASFVGAIYSKFICMLANSNSELISFNVLESCTPSSIVLLASE